MHCKQSVGVQPCTLLSSPSSALTSTQCSNEVSIGSQNKRKRKLEEELEATTREKEGEKEETEVGTRGVKSKRGLVEESEGEGEGERGPTPLSRLSPIPPIPLETTFTGLPQPSSSSSSSSSSASKEGQSKVDYKILVKGIEDMKDYAIFVLSTVGIVVSWNSGAQNIKGYPAGEVLGQHFSMFYTTGAVQRGVPNAELTAALDVGRFEDEGWRTRRDGSKFWANVIISPVFSKSGEHIGFTKITRDLTERKKLEEERLVAVGQVEVEKRLRFKEAEAQARQRVFTDRICHEIRNPVNGIFGNVEVMMESLQRLRHTLIEGRALRDSEAVSTIDTELEKMKEALDCVNECAEHQQAIADEVLRYSEVEACPFFLQVGSFDPREVAQSVGRMYKGSIEKKKLNISLVAPGSELELTIHNDSVRYKEILINLISNAIKFTQKGGVTISIDTVHIAGIRYLRTSIADTGSGISKDDQSKLYQRFSKSSSTDYKQYFGSGLGLVITKNLVIRMGGSICVDSKQGQGTKFTFTIRCDGKVSTDGTLHVEDPNVDSSAGIPCTKQLMPLSLTEEDEGHVGGNRKSRKALNQEDIPRISARILVVEDNFINQRVILAQLQKMGCSVVVANNGEEAVQITNSERFDMILMDISMPKMNGLEASKLIHEKEVQCSLELTPIVALSGNAQEKDKQAAFAAHMIDYLTKPFRTHELWAKVKGHLPHKVLSPSPSPTVPFL